MGKRKSENDQCYFQDILIILRGEKNCTKYILYRPISSITVSVEKTKNFFFLI